MTTNHLGRLIQERRVELDVTQRELAAWAGIKQQYLSKIEHGRETPSDQKIVQIAVALDLDRDELILAAGRIPDDVMRILGQHPDRALGMVRRVRKWPAP